MNRHPLLILTALGLGMGACKAPQGTVSPDSAPAFAPEQAQAKPLSTAQILEQSDLPATLATPLVDDPAQVSVHRLSNGLTVYLSPSDEKPTFDAWVAVRTGSRNDPKDSTGLAHYLEHMLFKGTHQLGTTDFEKEKVHIQAVAKLYDDLRKTQDPKKRGEIFAKIDQETQAMAKYAIPNELDRLYDSIGGKHVNAFTYTDGTVYHGSFPKNRLVTWAKNEAHRFQHPQFRLFFPELEAVYEEKNRSMDNTRSRANEALFAQIYPSHPYGTQTTIGTVEHLKTPAYGDMVRFFEQWYQPNNMAIALSGNFDRREALELIEKNFGKWQPKALPEPAAGSISPLKARTIAKVQGPTHPSATLAWVTTPASHQDEMALTVMDALVSHGDAGLISERLLLNQKLPHAASFNYLMNEGGSWILSGVAGHGQSLEQVEGELLRIVDAIRKGEFSDEQLAAVKLNLEIEHKRELETSRGRANAMISAFLDHKNWQDVADYNKRLAAVTRDDVLRVASQYLTPAYAVVYQERGPHTPPTIEKPKISPVQIDTTKQSSYFAEMMAIPVTPVAPRWLDDKKDYRTLPPSRPGFSVKNPNNDLFDLRFNYAIGDAKSPYLCYAMTLADKSGTKKQSAAQIKQALYALGTQVSLSCSEDESQVRLQGIAKNLKASVEIVDDWLKNIEITQTDTQRFAANTLALRQSQVNNPKILSQALFQYGARGKKSPMLQALSNQKLSAMQGKALTKEVRNLLNTKYDIAYFGPESKTQIETLAALGRPTKRAPSRPALRMTSPKNSELLYIDTPQSQASIRIRWNSDIKSAKDRVLAKVANAYLGGMGGRLFQEVREARGLAYSVGAQAQPGTYKNDDGYLIAYLGTQADKTPEAIEVVLEQLAAPILPKALEAAKLALTERYRGEHITARDTLSSLGRWKKAGHKQDPRAEEMALIESIDAKTLGDYLQTVTKKPAQITIVGPKGRLGLDKLAKFGTVKEVKADDVFSYGTFPNQAPATNSRR